MGERTCAHVDIFQLIKTTLTDFAKLEVFNDALSSYVIQRQKF